jgi:2-polyprenyl-3-methyl-5-hydroxy-6-metoxy-1,4-benzoquinol methylase
MKTLGRITKPTGSTYFSNTRSEMLAFIPTGRLGRVLEIGCASGIFIESLNADERWGVEPNDAVACQARDRGITVLVGLYAQVESSIPDAYFDLIVANDVIEHMTDHEEFLQVVKRKLSPQGCLVGSVPNIRHLSELLKLIVLKDWRYTEDGVLDKTHLRFFTQRSLRRSLMATGYEAERISGLRSVFRFDAGIPLKKAIANWLITLLAIVVTLGHASDTQYLQFGFRARPRAQ